MADFSNDISKSLQGLTNIPVGDLATGIKEFSEALKEAGQTTLESNVTGKQFNQILKLQAAANKKHIKSEKTNLANEKKKYKEENTLWQRATRQNREHLKIQKAMIKGMTGSTRQMTGFGRAQEKLFGGMKKGASGAAGGVMKLAGKAGALGLVVVALKTIVDKILEADQILAGMAKTAGVFRDTLRKGWQPAIAGVRSDLVIMGVQLQEIAENANAMLNNLTKTNIVNEGFLKTSTLVSKVFGTGAEATAKFFGAIQEQTTITSKNMHEMVESIVQYSNTGTNVARVTRDMVANTNLIAIYGQDQVKNLIEMARYASDNGTTLEGIQGTMDALGGDYENAADAITEMNRRWGTNFDAMKAHQVAFANDAKAQQKYRDDMIDDLAKQHNMRSENRGLETAFNRGEIKTLKALGIAEKEIRLRQVRNRRARGEQLTADNRALEESVKKQRTLEGLLQQQRTIWDKIKSIVTGPINKALEWIGTFLEEHITGVLDNLTLKMKLLFDGKGLQADLESGDWGSALKKVFSPIFTIVKDALAEAFDYISDNYEIKTNAIGIPKGFGRKGSSIKGEVTNIAVEQQKLVQKRESMESGRGRGILAGEARYTTGRVVAKKEKLKELQEKAKGKLTEKELAKNTKNQKALKEELKNLNKESEDAKYALAKFDNELKNTVDSIAKNQETLAKLRKSEDKDLAITAHKAMEDAFKGFLETEEGKQASEAIKAKEGVLSALGPGIDELMEFHKQKNIWMKSLELKALGGFGGLSVVGEAGGEVVASRSALRSGIGIGGKAASALAGIGVPGFQYGIAATGETGGRTTRGLQAQAASKKQNEQLLAYQEVVYQDRKNQIERDEANYRRSYKESKQYQNALDGFTRDVEFFGSAGVDTFYGAVLEDKDNRRDWVGDIRKSIDAYPAILDHTLRSTLGIGLGDDTWTNATYTASFAALKAWAGGKNYTQAAAVGVAEGLKKDGVFNRMLVKIDKLRESNAKDNAATAIALNGLGMGLEQGLRRFAETADPKKAREAAIRGTIAGLIQQGGRSLAGKIGGTEGMQAQFGGQIAKSQQWGQLFDILGPGGVGGLGLGQMEQYRQAQGYGQYGPPGAAKGKYVNSPTLMMVGEENRGEVVIPTERIRRGLPINAGVARELGSIGVPGFGNGVSIRDRAAAAAAERDASAVTGGTVDMSATEANAIRSNLLGTPATASPSASISTYNPSTISRDIQAVGSSITEWKPSAGGIDPASPAYAGPLLQGLIDPNAGVGYQGVDFSGGISGTTPAAAGDSIQDAGDADKSDPGNWGQFKEAGGFSALGKYSLQGAITGATNQAVADILSGAPTDRVIANAATAGIQTGVSIGATALISLIPGVGPILGPIAGPLIGKLAGHFAGKWLGDKLGVDNPRFGKFRKQAMRTLKEHMASDMAIEPGMPPGLGGEMTKAIMGRFNKPTAESYGALKDEIQKNTDLNSAEAQAFIKLYTEGKTPPGKSVEATYAHLNKKLGLPEPLAFAAGGIVSGPTAGIVGEAGPEAVIPLDQGGIPTKRDEESKKDSEQMIREMIEIKKAMLQMLKLMGNGKTTINMDGRVVAEVAAANMQTIAAGL